MPVPALLEMLAAHPVAAGVFDPATLPGLVWLNDALNAGSIHATASRVDQWDNISGGGGSVTSTFAVRPWTATHTIGSNNAIYFDGTPPLGNRQFLTGAVLSLSQPFTVFAVVKWLSGSNARVFDTSSGARSLVNINATKVQMYSGSGPVDSGNNSGNAMCLMFMFNGSSSKCQVDSTLTTSLNPGTAGIGTMMLGQDLGNGAPGEFDLAHIAFCSGDQSASITNYRSYAQTTWGTP